MISAGAGCDLSYTLTDSPLLTGADPALGQQWHLRNIGQGGGTPGEDLKALDAWSTTRGAGVRVAVVDDAVEIVHPDLRPNLVDGASRSYRTGNVNPAFPLPCIAAVDDHGTAVAGLVLARDDNAVGGAGIAPRASLVAYDALASGQDADIADALNRELEANSIFQNSWGSPDDGALHPSPVSFQRAISTGLATGRGGRGAIYVFPGGNGGCYAVGTDGASCFSDNANFDGFVNRTGIVTVCSVDDNGRRPFYGEPGANLLVCAPSSGDVPNVTTAGLRGESRNDFSGTSASTPMVAGVVALMLAANPELTWRDVRLILAQSARRNDPTDPGWLPTADGPAFNHKYGFGVADARAAVSLASGWPSVGGTAQMKTCTITERSPVLSIPDYTGTGAAVRVTDSTTVGDCAITRIESVEITVIAPHTYSGDLRLTLTSPLGNVSELAAPRVCARTSGDSASAIPCGDFAPWTFTSVRHLGEAANGTWTIGVSDESPQDTGRLDRWSLRIHGR